MGRPGPGKGDLDPARWMSEGGSGGPLSTILSRNDVTSKLGYGIRSNLATMFVACASQVFVFDCAKAVNCDKSSISCS